MQKLIWNETKRITLFLGLFKKGNIFVEGVCITASRNISSKLFMVPLETIELLTFW